MEDNRSKDELLKIIEQKEQRIQYLERVIKSYGLYVPDTEVKFGNEEKIRIFMDYFRCRPDLYAERFYSRKKESFGWNPVCRNSFTTVCGKKNGKFNCFQCKYSQFEPVNTQAVKNHFLGSNQGIGFYPLMPDGTCWWLAIDFDHDSWFENMLSVYREAVSLELYPVMERSQSGQGGHLWFFFASAVKATLARRMGDMLLKRAMNRNPALSFSSFDRMFPNQDYIPEGGAGNLIALPLRYDAYQKGNSAFIDTEQRVIRQPIEYLVSRPRITWEELQAVLNNDSEEDYFFDEDQMQLRLMTDIKYDRDIYGEISSWLKIRKRGLSAATLNILKRCATMYNPTYFELQRLHKPIYFNGKVSKMLSYYEEDDHYLYLPKGLVSALHRVMPEAQLHFEDHLCQGETIDVSFQGALRDDQKDAAEQLLKHNMGILQAIPGFGKTVVAIYLISVLKVNTLILVNKKNLQQQWEERMETFLACPPARLKRDRYINKYGASRKKLNGKIDIAMVMTLANEEEIEALVSGYGLVIVDECHHVACDSFLRVMRNIRAAHVYGFSATPRRDDGLFKVITMFCGPIRKRIDSSQSQSFEKILVPRYTNHRYLKDDINYPDMCAELAEDRVRNFMI
ncbi:MAG: DEAD/DEAH box helicase family protein, partial [Solobacterium sp.]|nr:DEAD/DEAH box helicase family protein [Solobacterium sp.]